LNVIRQLAKDSAIYGGADLISKIISFFTFPFIAKALSPESFGFLELILTSTALLGVVANFGLNNAVQRFYWDTDVTENRRKEIVSSGLVTLFFTVTSVLIITFIGVMSTKVFWKIEVIPFSNFGLTAALLLMGGTQWTQFILDVIRLQFSPWKFLIISMTSRVLSALAGLYMVVSLALGIDGLLGAQAIVVLLVLPMALNFIRKDFSIGKVSKKWSKELIEFGYPFIFSSLAYWIFSSQDRWMLASMTTVEEVGIYSVSFRFASVILFVSAAFGQAWSPVAIKIRTDNPEKYRKIYGDVLILLVFSIAALAGGLALFSGEIIHFIMGNDYLKSALPMAILGFAIVFQASQQITGIGISLEKKTKLFAHLSWITAGVNFGFNWFLIPIFGALGAAIATALSYLFLSLGYFFFTQRYHPIHISYNRLMALISLMGIVLVISFYMQNASIEWIPIALKLGILASFVGLGWILLPIKNFKNV
jgi:O-antigen/teichoic acid export membrane protein